MNIIIDLETSIKCPVGNHKANPMWLGNKIVAAGWCSDGETVATEYNVDGVDVTMLLEKFKEADLVVGHNIKFDLLYIYRNTSNMLPRIWDTQLAAYILSSQRHLYASLDELTVEYISAFTCKDEKIKNYWKAGIDTEDIPKEELLPYLVGDVSNTTRIFEAQFIETESMGVMALMLTQMEALRATIEMNRHGMRVDWDYVNTQATAYGEVITDTAAKIEALVPGINYLSPKELSQYYFGGTKVERVRIPDGFYKNGNPKTKAIDVSTDIVGKYLPINAVVKGGTGQHSVDDAVLTKLSDRGDELARQLLVMRKAQKIKETYYEGLKSLQFPNGNIYPNLNHCATKTGRLSSTNPNLQNQTEVGNVKAAYVSRYTDGKIVELDYSQLEMVALAYLSDDKQLIADINGGLDMHRELYKEMYGRMPTDKERKPFKRFSFLLVYGGGAATLMAQSGCDKPTATKFINTFYNRYKGVKEYHEHIVKIANKEEVFRYDKVTSGPKYVYYHSSPTGRHYVFNKYPNEYRKGELTFSPTELKNWPIQGFATGDVVPMMVGQLLRRLEEAGYADKALLIMTVHDSVVLDVPPELVYDVAMLAKKTLEDAPKYLKKFFNIDFPCKLGVGVEVGINWQKKSEL